MPDPIKPEQDPKPDWTPASPAKRALAWMGIVYMVILVLLTTYNLATGEPLHGIPGILLFPACGGLSALSWLRYRAVGGFHHCFMAVLAALCGLVSLVLGVLSLISALGG